MPIDVLSDILDATKLQGTLYFSTELSAPWGIRVPLEGRVARFHLVVRGRLWIRVAGCDEPACLEPGDLVLVPHGAVHELLDDPETTAETLEQVLEDSGFDGKGSLTYGGEDRGSPTRLVCGHFALDPHVEHPLLQRLPSMIVIRREDDARGALQALIDAISREATGGGPGAHAVIRRFAEVLFIQALRVWAQRANHDTGLLAALADPQLGEGLQLMHERPAHGWTLEDLSHAVGLSRTVFAERFKEQVGLPPMQYLTLWRMQRARTLLVDTDMNLEQVAEHVGYESAAALSRVFKRTVGQAPGSYRNDARDAAP